MSRILAGIGSSRLDLQYLNLGPLAVKPLAEALRQNTLVEDLDLRSNGLTGYGTATLCKMFHDNVFIVSLVRIWLISTKMLLFNQLFFRIYLIIASVKWERNIWETY